MSYSHFYVQPTFMESYYYIADKLKHQARLIEKQRAQERYISPSPTNYPVKVDVRSNVEFDAAEAIEIIIDTIEQVIGPHSDYIKELAQKWSDRIINLSFQHLRLWRNLRYQGVCTISQRSPNQYVATTFSGDPASRGECSVIWHNGNISVLAMVRGYKNS
ncbi:uncharacterized protein LOC106884354 [Octopus bimaculoides]|uniref:Uncharacterized protein n=1 Tax=Octopus bimaculoides TaxID=37653 RepID=A0A0L8I3B9_OCTBM|nr:uncharacterized protein LOC106884354 [Octopus bimaculoides]